MKSKKIIKYILIILLTITITGCTNKENDAMKFKEEYEKYNNKETGYGKEYPKVEISEDNIIKYSNMKEIIKIIDNKKSAVIYLGYPDCPWCRNVVPVLLEAANSTALDEIYYVNMTNKRDEKEIDENGKIITTKEASDEYYELMKKLDSILLEYTTKDEEGNEISLEEKRIYVPLVVFIEKGKIVDYHIDTVPTQIDPFIKLTEEEQIELYNIYTKGIHKVLGDVCEEDAHC